MISKGCGSELCHVGESCRWPGISVFESCICSQVNVQKPRHALISASDTVAAFRTMGTRQQWWSFDRDVVTIQAAMLHESMCMSIFVLLLRLLEGRAARGAAAAVMAVTLLVAEPALYQSQSQPYGYIMASMCFLTALSMLHWALMEPVAARPSIAQAVMSPTVHSCHGIVKVQNKMQRQHNNKHMGHQQPAKKASSLRALVVVDSTGADPQPAPTWECISNWLAAREPIARAFIRSCGTWGKVCVQYDVGLYVLCGLSGNMCYCTRPSSAGVSVMTHPSAVQLMSFLQRPPVKLALFSCAASHLLLDFMYCSTRTMMLAAALVWPRTAQEALDMPCRGLANPWAATSITDLWGFRWVQFLRFYIDGLDYAAVDELLPKGKDASPVIRASARMVASFMLHGLMHEYVLWAAFSTLSGLNLAFLA